MNWDHPQHEEFKAVRDSSVHLRSWYIAQPLVKKQLDGHPLTEAERAYLEVFYMATVCQEFFCRLEIQFVNNSPCWLDGVPTEEQCQRCKMNYLSSNVVNFGREHEAIAEPDSIVALHVFKEEGITKFAWRPNVGEREGLTGEYWPGGMTHHSKSPFSGIFPVCLPSLSPTFDNECDHDCAKCPAHGYYDTSKNVTLAGLGTVKLSDATLPPRVVEQLRQRSNPQELPPDEQLP